MLDEKEILPLSELTADSLMAALQNRDHVVIFNNDRPLWVVQNWSDFKKRGDNSDRAIASASGLTESRTPFPRQVRSILQHVMSSQLIDEDEVERLTSIEYSNQTFGQSFAVLKQQNPSLPLEQQVRGLDGRNRYYSLGLSYKNRVYYLTNHWFEKIHGERFWIWCRQRGFAFDDTSASLQAASKTESAPELSFREWLKSEIPSAAVRANTLSRCRHVVQRLEVNLSEQYAHDGGAELLKQLTYTSADWRDKKPLPPGLSFDNPVAGMGSLKTAVRKFFEFKAVGGVDSEF